MSGPPMLSVALAGTGLPAVRDISSTWRAFMGIEQDGNLADAYRTMSDFAKVPADEAWVYRCVAIKAAFAQSVPLRVWVREGKTRIPAADTTDTAAHDLQGLLDDVNADEMNGSDLIAWTVAARSVWGEAYWRKVRGRLGGPPQELYWRRAPDITPKLGARWIDSYDYRGRLGQTENWPARDVVPFRTINLADPTRGLSPLASARLEIAVDRQAADWTVSTLGNWGVPATAWVIPKDAEFSANDRSLVKRALSALRGPRNQGRSAILPRGLEPKQLALNPKDAEWLAARKLSRMTIAAVLGVPLVLAGDDDKASVYANLRDAERVFAREMIGELDWIAASINGWLVPDFDSAPHGRRRLVVAFDYDGIEALQAPLEERKRVALSEVERAVRSRDEYRAEFRVGPPLPPEIAQYAVVNNLVPISVRAPAAPSPEVEVDRPVVDAGSDATRRLYRDPLVRTWIADPSPDNLAAVGRLLDLPATAELAEGLRRRYSVPQIVDGVPAEGFPGLAQGVQP